MLYCPENVTFSQPWIDHGLSHCFIDTLAPIIICVYITICGGIQCYIYKKYSSTLDSRLLPKSNLFKVQVIISILFPIFSVLHLIFQATILGNRIIYGYMILSACLSTVFWPFSLYILLLERQRALPSVPTRGHGLVLLLFWTLYFFNENIAFLNLRNEKWWFGLNSFSDHVELGLFITRYAFSMLLFFIGMKAPGIPSTQDYFVYRQLNLQSNETQPLLEEGRLNQPANRSTFVNYLQKFRRLGPFLWPKKSLLLQVRVIFCFMLLVLGRIVNIYVPMYNKAIINSLSEDPKQLMFRWDFILIYVTLWFLQGQGNNSLLNNIRSFLWIRVQQYTVKEVRLDVFKHLHSLSLRWHLNRKIGEVLRVMDRGTNSITSLLSYIVFNILPTFADIFIAVIYFSLAFNIWFGILVFVTMFLYLGATIAITEWRTKYRRNMNKLDNAVEAKALDSLLNFETVKYYCTEEYELQSYKDSIEGFQGAEWISNATMSLLNVMQNTMITLGILAGSLLCAHMVVTGNHLNVGDYVLFSTYILQLYTPLNYFGTYYSYVVSWMMAVNNPCISVLILIKTLGLVVLTLCIKNEDVVDFNNDSYSLKMVQTAFIDMENMFDLLQETPDVVDDPNAPLLKIDKGCIEFSNVNFSYVPERQILKNVSFVVPAGHTVALVGQTGSGKSTIVRLLFRLYDVHSGEILIDGQNISQVNQYSLRKCIGVVPQDTVLFNNDIRYNIRYGRVAAADEEVEAAAKAADMHNQILSFPDAYDTVVGERGLKLSGGEKQRVAIARTILKNPAFVILDEATSALDTETERNIQSSLENICAGKTTIIIAHRLSTIIHADQILVIKEGEVVERGSHEELLEKEGSYAKMWYQQLHKKEEDDDVKSK